MVANLDDWQRAKVRAVRGLDPRLGDWLAGEPRRRRERPHVRAVLAKGLDGWERWGDLDDAGRAALVLRVADDLDAYRAFRGELQAADVRHVVEDRLGGLDAVRRAAVVIGLLGTVPGAERGRQRNAGTNDQATDDPTTSGALGSARRMGGRERGGPESLRSNPATAGEGARRRGQSGEADAQGLDEGGKRVNPSPGEKTAKPTIPSDCKQ